MMEVPQLKNRDEDGFIIATLLASMTFLFLISVIIFRLVINNYKIADAQTHRINAQFAADAGADIAISELNNDEDWPGTSLGVWNGTAEEITFYTDSTADFESKYLATIVDGLEDDEKTIEVTGRVYSPLGSTNLISERSYSVDMRGLGVGGNGGFSIVTGVGGLILENSAKIVNGSVYVNGTISLSNQAQIGTTSTSVAIRAAHNSCPTLAPYTSYPSPCTSEEPISVNSPATIYGQVCANNQTTSSGIDNSGSNGLFIVGTSPECDDDPLPGINPNPLPALPLPVHDRDQQKADIVVDCRPSAGNCPGGNHDYVDYTTCDSNSGTRTWENGLKIDGDVVIAKKCKVTIEGDVWITGSLTVRNNAEIIVSELFDPATVVDNNLPSIMVDSQSGITFNNSAAIVDNSNDIGVQFVTYWSEASCSPDCSDVSGLDLLNSGDETTIYLEQSAEAPGSILYAKWSQIDLNNGGDIGALVGQTVKMRNSAAVTFGAAVTTGPGPGSSNPTWLVRNYRKN